MAIPVAQKLLEQAQAGIRLSAPDRRHVLTFLMATNDDLTNDELATLFQVSSKMVRIDKQRIKQSKLKELEKEDVGLIVSDLVMCYEREIRELVKGRQKAKPGTLVHMHYCKAITDLRSKVVENLQSLGWLPKDLGTVTKQVYEFSASVSASEPPKAVAAAEPAQLPAPLEAEFTEIPLPEDAQCALHEAHLPPPQ